jgi:CRP-like cAMP-binding protein
VIFHEGLDRALRRLETRGTLEDADREAFRALPFAYRPMEPNTYLVREGETPVHCGILLSGFAYRHKITGEGERQILSVHMAGEFLDLQNSFLGVADHNVQILTRAEVAQIAIPELVRLVADHPRLARALWIDTLIDSAVFREWLVNVGRRPSISRIAHLLCELALRLRSAGLADNGRYELPMTQEHLADATGLTAVHVNRVLRELGRTGLIARNKRSVEILDWPGLSGVGDFSMRYLHQEVGGPNPPPRSWPGSEKIPEKQ